MKAVAGDVLSSPPPPPRATARQPPTHSESTVTPTHPSTRSQAVQHQERKAPLLLDYITERRSRLAGRNQVVPRGLEDRLAKLEAELRAQVARPECA